ncbi:MAG TPA: cation:proton antiporter, partial [Geobacterales bacterium]|nr:cation:proton antiporter [Geobacterales bacterium]
MVDFLLQIGLLTGLTAILGYLFRHLKIPLVTAYIVIGLILGPFSQIVNPNSELISFMAELGILLITFEIGITMRLGFLRTEGLRISIIVLTELIVIIFLAYFFGLILNLSWLYTLFLILFAVNTSTSIAFKLFEESNMRNEFGDKEVKTVLGIATFEDLIAIIGIGVFTSIITLQTFTLSSVFFDISKLVLLFIGLIGVGLVMLRRLLNFLAKYGDELILLSGIAVALIFSWVANSIGLSPVLGSFIGGIVFSETKAAEYFLERAKWVREIFAFIFFASIGLRFPVNVDLNLVLIGIGVSLFIVMLKFIAFSFSIWASGFELEKAAKFSVYMVAISEFAVIITSIALGYGVVGPEMLVIAVSVMVISSILASILSSRSDVVANAVVKLIPARLRNNIENYIFRPIRMSFERRGAAFDAVKSSVRDLVLIVSFAFTVSVFFVYVLNYIVQLNLISNQVIFVIVIGAMISFYIIILLEIYATFARLFRDALRISLKGRSRSVRIPVFSIASIIVLLILSFT